jgi:Cu-processing system permease protein
MMTLKVLKYVLYDVLRSRMVIAYALLLFVFSYALFNLESDPSKSVLSLLNIVLLLVPLISIIFGTIHFYNSKEFIEMLLAQPMSRRSIFFSEFLGVSLSLAAALLFGIGIPLVTFGFTDGSLIMLTVGILLTFVFTAISVWSAVITNDKAKGIGVSLLLWFYFTILYDGFVLLVLFYFSDYPMEKVMMVLSALNPVDLGRISVLLRLDVSALMGYTGAVFQKFLGTAAGTATALLLLLLWSAVPLYFGSRFFRRKDL